MRRSDVCKKIGDTLRDRSLSSEHRAKIGDAHRGRPKSEEQRRKMSEASLGKPKSPKHRRAIAAAGARHLEQHFGYSWIRLRHGRVEVHFPWSVNWVRLSWVVWTINYGPVPMPNSKRRKDQYLIHHWDRNPLNDSAANLRLWLRGQHDVFHMLLKQRGHAVTPDGEHVALASDGRLIVL